MSENAKEYKKLNMKELESRITKTISAKEALKDIEPMCWSEEIISGQKKVIITKKE